VARFQSAIETSKAEPLRIDGSFSCPQTHGDFQRIGRLASDLSAARSPLINASLLPKWALGTLITHGSTFGEQATGRRDGPAGGSLFEAHLVGRCEVGPALARRRCGRHRGCRRRSGRCKRRRNLLAQMQTSLALRCAALTQDIRLAASGSTRSPTLEQRRSVGWPAMRERSESNGGGGQSPIGTG